MRASKDRARPPGDRVARRLVSGGRDPARRRHARARRAAAGPGQRLGRRRRRRPAGVRLATAWAAAKASAGSSPRTSWQVAVDEALRQALVNLSAVPAPAGTFDVVLGPGWPGILLHEAVGHGLEGDFNRKKESAFAGLMGQRVASPGVTVVDDGTHRQPARLAHRRRRGHADAVDDADRGRHPRRLHAGPAERPPDGHEADRQRPPPVLRPHPDAAHDQHRSCSPATTTRRRSSPR